MSDSLGITTVAEGIEEATQAERMLALGCTYGQGYYFARPVPADQVPAILADVLDPPPATGAQTATRAEERRGVRLPRTATSIDASPA